MQFFHANVKLVYWKNFIRFARSYSLFSLARYDVISFFLSWFQGIFFLQFCSLIKSSLASLICNNCFRSFVMKLCCIVSFWIKWLFFQFHMIIIESLLTDKKFTHFARLKFLFYFEQVLFLNELSNCLHKYWPDYHKKILHNFGTSNTHKYC